MNYVFYDSSESLKSRPIYCFLRATSSRDLRGRNQFLVLRTHLHSQANKAFNNGIAGLVGILVKYLTLSASNELCDDEINLNVKIFNR